MKYVIFHNDEVAIRAFTDLAKRLYGRRDNMEDAQTVALFLRGTHPLSKYCTLTPFLICDNDRVAGRFCVIRYPEEDTAYVGFYECEEDERVATFLFKTLTSYCASHGIRRIEGPVDASFWQKYRLKSSHFGLAPYTGEPYNKEYYFKQFTDNGFSIKEHYESHAFRAVDMSYENAPFKEHYESFLQKGYRIESPDASQFDALLEDVYEMISVLYADFPVFKAVAREDFKAVFSDYKKILSYPMTKIAYYEDKAVGFYITIPDYGNSVYHLNPFNLLQILRTQKKPKRYVMLYMGVMPEHKGLGMALVYSVMQELKQTQAESIGALIRDGKRTGMYATEDITDVYEYVLLEKTL